MMNRIKFVTSYLTNLIFNKNEKKYIFIVDFRSDCNE